MDAILAVFIAGLGILTGWSARPYLVKRSEKQAEYDAILSNLGTIKTRVEVTERTAAEIKSEIDQKEWRERERIVLMRSKLEAALLAGFQLREAVDKLQGTMTDDNPSDDVDMAANRLEMLTTLYFPALRAPAAALRITTTELAMSARGFHAAFALYVATRAVDPNSAATAKAFSEFEQVKISHFGEAEAKLKRIRAALMNFTDAAAGEISKYAP